MVIQFLPPEALVQGSRCLADINHPILSDLAILCRQADTFTQFDAIQARHIRDHVSRQDAYGNKLSLQQVFLSSGQSLHGFRNCGHRFCCLGSHSRACSCRWRIGRYRLSANDLDHTRTNQALQIRYLTIHDAIVTAIKADATHNSPDLLLVILVSIHPHPDELLEIRNLLGRKRILAFHLDDILGFHLHI